ncbi:MAG: hypothetical protein MJE63_01435 [Proteobacteria bacterium]|nr:hypothetical protein [Pseudomonadota bacterium]
MISSSQSKELLALIQKYRSQLYLDFTIKGFAALVTETADHNLQPTEYEALQVAESAHNMVDQIIKRVELSFKTDLRKPK